MRAVDLPLHTGHAPRWLFEKMVRLSRLIALHIVEEYGTREFLERLANPYWFQAFSMVIGFDWHSSGTTTTALGALKEALNGSSPIFVAGGKGRAALKTPEMVHRGALLFSLSYAKAQQLERMSRLSAKVDSVAVQDGYALYHHTLVFDEKGNAVVVQQGMNAQRKYARRYHWLPPSSSLEHNIGGVRHEAVLHFVGREAEGLRRAVVDAASSLKDVEVALRFPERHAILKQDLTKRDWAVLKALEEYQPRSFEELLLFKGLGGKKLRALALTASLIYGEELQWKDPVKYAYAHGGKDGIPYPVDREAYEESIAFLQEALEGAPVERQERARALRRLARLLGSGAALERGQQRLPL